MVTRSSAFAASNTMPATLLPISAVMSEHCMSYAFQDCPFTPYWSYRLTWAAGCFGAAGVATSESIPPVAGSGTGTDGWQMLLRSPISPLDPAWHNPNSPPMSPMPGTPQGPVACGTVAAGGRPRGPGFSLGGRAL